MNKKVMYKPRKGDVLVVDGNHVMYLRNETLRTAFCGEVFFRDNGGKEQFVVCDEYANGDKTVKCAGKVLERVEIVYFSARQKVWRIAGSAFLTDADLADVCDLEIRKDKADAEDEVFPKTVFDVYERFNGNSKLLETFDTRKEAEQYCRRCRVQKWLERNAK